MNLDEYLERVREGARPATRHRHGFLPHCAEESTPGYWWLAAAAEFRSVVRTLEL